MAAVRFQRCDGRRATGCSPVSTSSAAHLWNKCEVATEVAAQRLSHRSISTPLCRADVAGQKIQDGVGEDVVAIAGDHVSGPADVGELDLREASEELVRPLLAD